MANSNQYQQQPVQGGNPQGGYTQPQGQGYTQQQPVQGGNGGYQQPAQPQGQGYTQQQPVQGGNPQGGYTQQQPVQGGNPQGGYTQQQQPMQQQPQQPTQPQQVNIHVLSVHCPDPNDPSQNYFIAVLDGEQNNPNAKTYKVSICCDPDDRVMGVSMHDRMVSASKGGGRAPMSYIKTEDAKKYVGFSFALDKALIDEEKGEIITRWLKRLQYGNDPTKTKKGPAIVSARPDPRHGGKVAVQDVTFIGATYDANDPHGRQKIMQLADESYEKITGEFGEVDNNGNEINRSSQPKNGFMLVVRSPDGYVVGYTEVIDSRVPGHESEYPDHYDDKRKFYTDRSGKLKFSPLPLDGRHANAIIEQQIAEAKNRYGDGCQVSIVQTTKHPASRITPPLSDKVFDRNDKSPKSPIEEIHARSGFTCTSVAGLPLDQNGQVLLNGPVNPNAICYESPIGDVTYRLPENSKGLHGYINGGPNFSVTYPKDDANGNPIPFIEQISDPNGKPFKASPLLRDLIVGYNSKTRQSMALGYRSSASVGNAPPTQPQQQGQGGYRQPPQGGIGYTQQGGYPQQQAQQPVYVQPQQQPAQPQQQPMQPTQPQQGQGGYPQQQAQQPVYVQPQQQPVQPQQPMQPTQPQQGQGGYPQQQAQQPVYVQPQQQPVQPQQPMQPVQQQQPMRQQAPQNQQPVYVQPQQQPVQQQQPMRQQAPQNQQPVHVQGGYTQQPQQGQGGIGYTQQGSYQQPPAQGGQQQGQGGYQPPAQPQQPVQPDPKEMLSQLNQLNQYQGNAREQAQQTPAMPSYNNFDR